MLQASFMPMGLLSIPKYAVCCSDNNYCFPEGYTCVVAVRCTRLYETLTTGKYEYIC